MTMTGYYQAVTMNEILGEQRPIATADVYIPVEIPQTNVLREGIFRDICAARNEADKKHGDSQTRFKPRPEREFGAEPLRILMEEVGEVAKALNDKEGYDRVYAELVDVTQSAVAWMEGIAARAV